MTKSMIERVPASRGCPKIHMMDPIMDMPITFS